VDPLSEYLPRLLYFADVPVEASYHGSALLYRLLQDYPLEKLLIIERWPYLSQTTRRLAGVEYRRLPSGLTRLLPTRFHHAAVPLFMNLAWLDARLVWRKIADFRPEAVLSVHHGYSWLSAFAMGSRRRRPVHLILHDDCGVEMGGAPSSQTRWQRHCQTAYRQAASRLCVSPFMVDEYERRYGARGTVLYPGRAKDAPSYDAPPERLRHLSGRLTVAYGGNIFVKNFADALREVSVALERMGGRLLLFGPHRAEDAARWGLNRANVECRGLLTSAQMIQAFRDEADCIFVPMSFDSSDRPNTEISFPSKLTDATIPGVPLLIWGPPYCSAMRWARDNPGVAELVDQCEPGLLRAALQRIQDNAVLRWELGQSAMIAGRKFFGFEIIRDTFFKSVRQNSREARTLFQTDLLISPH
jgi:hypothetical protein